MSVLEAKHLLEGLTVAWWIAGGWAIDLFIGRQTRDHGDIDVLVLRRDQLSLREHLSSWDLYYTVGELRPWPRGLYLPEGSGANGIWCRPKPDAPWSLELMLMDTDGEDWVYRRAPQVRGPLSTIGRYTPDGIPYLAPHIQLLFKAKAVPLSKDQQDFDIVSLMLSPAERDWLADALCCQFPGGHCWEERLRA